MRLTFCVLCGCGDAEKLEFHHAIPKSAGGGDEDANILTVCHACHGKIHGIERADIRVLSAAGRARMTSAQVRAAQKNRVRTYASRLKRRKKWFADVVEPTLRIATHGILCTAEAAAETLNNAGIGTPTGKSWTPELFRRWARVVGSEIYVRQPFAKWAAEHADLAAQVCGDGRGSYATVAKRLEVAGDRPDPDWQWTPGTARRFLRAVGLTLSGNASPEKMHRRAQDVVEVAGSAFTRREYSQIWRSFNRWRGHDGLPVTDMELAGFIERRLTGLSRPRAAHIISALSHVHRALGHDKLSMREIVKNFKAKNFG